MTTNEIMGHWYHGGQFEDGKPKGDKGNPSNRFAKTWWGTFRF